MRSDKTHVDSDCVLENAECERILCTRRVEACRYSLGMCCLEEARGYRLRVISVWFIPVRCKSSAAVNMLIRRLLFQFDRVALNRRLLRHFRVRCVY